MFLMLKLIECYISRTNVIFHYRRWCFIYPRSRSQRSSNFSNQGNLPCVITRANLLSYSRAFALNSKGDTCRLLVLSTLRHFAKQNTLKIMMFFRLVFIYSIFRTSEKIKYYVKISKRRLKNYSQRNWGSTKTRYKIPTSEIGSVMDNMNTYDHVDLRGKYMRFVKDRECINGKNHSKDKNCRAKAPVHIAETRSVQVARNIACTF